MKTKLFFAICMLIATFAFGQNSEINEVEVTAPQFTGQQNAVLAQKGSSNEMVRNWLKGNIVYPERAIKCGIEGTEVVKFTVTTEGNVADIQFVNSVCPEINYAIESALETTNGMWLPGLNNGEPVAMSNEISFAFCCKTTDENDVTNRFKEKATNYFSAANKALFEKKNVKKALKYFDRGINYLPYDNSLLLMRGMCRYELGDKEGAMQDWDRLSEQGSIDMRESISQIEGMKGFNDLMVILNK